MRRKSFRGAWLLVAWLAFAPAAWGQSDAPAPAWGQSAAPAGLVPSIDDLWPAAERRSPPPAGSGGGPGAIRRRPTRLRPGDFVSPLPIGSTRPEDGGLFVAAQALYFTQSNPLKSQVVGVYGFRDRDGSITGTVDQFVGSGQRR